MCSYFRPKNLAHFQGEGLQPLHPRPRHSARGRLKSAPYARLTWVGRQRQKAPRLTALTEVLAKKKPNLPQASHFCLGCGNLPRAMTRIGARAISSAPLSERSHPHPHPLAARVSGVCWGGQAVDLREEVKNAAPRCRGKALRSTQGPSYSGV
jgi:hypothetical protein